MTFAEELSRRRQVLLIEDNPGDARLIAEGLREVPGEPFALEHVTSLSEGLERLSQSDFELLLLDLGLPDSQGKDTLARVAELAPDLAIVILTGLDDESFADEALLLGAQDYLVKGEIEARQLSRSLRYAIERKHIENTLREANVKEELDRQEERERIGMDLHDGVIQDIYAVGLSLELALGDIEDAGAEARHSLEKAIQQLHEVVSNIRCYIFDLRPRQFEGDIARALGDIAREFEQDSHIQTQTEVEGDFGALRMEQGIALYHIAHEALSNARKHAHPEIVLISLSASDQDVRLEIRDNGSGFDVSRGLPERHRGMRNMANRAQGIGAQLEIESTPGSGTVIRVVVPRSANVTPLRPRSRFTQNYAA